MVVIPDDRDVHASLDDAGGEAVVVACPPHPQYGGSRRDGRLRAVAQALNDRSVDCLRIDYGAWDGGRGETEDVASALAWAADRHAPVGLFGYSFGAGVALRVAAGRTGLRAVSVLAPPATSVEDGDAAAAVDSIDAPLQVVVGERDTTVEWEPVVEQARAAGATVEHVPGDHRFGGRTDRVGGLVGTFLAGHGRGSDSTADPSP